MNSSALTLLEATASPSTPPRPKKKKKPASKSRGWGPFQSVAKERSVEFNLTLDVQNLQQEICDLSTLRDVLSTRTTLRRHSPEGSLFHVVAEYLQVFRAGWAIQETGRKRLLGEQDQRAFLHSVMDPELDVGHGLRGPDVLAEQIILYSTFIKFINVKLTNYDIVVAEDTVVIKTQAKLKFQVLRKTIEMVFPHIIGDECLVAQLVGQEVEPPIGITFSFDGKGKCCKYEFEVDFVEAFARIVKDPRKLDMLLGRALITDNCMFGLIDEPLEVKSNTQKDLVGGLNELQSLSGIEDGDLFCRPHLSTRRNEDDRYYQVIDDYYFVFAKGYRPHNNEKDEQADFIAQAFFPGRSQGGGQYALERWQALSMCFGVLEFRQTSAMPVEYNEQEDMCTIPSTASYTLRITPSTLESAFPHLVPYKQLIDTLVANVLVVPSQLVFSIEMDTGRIFRIVERMDFIAAMVPLFQNREELSFVMSQAQLSLDGVIWHGSKSGCISLPPLIQQEEELKNVTGDVVSEKRATHSRTMNMADILTVAFPSSTSLGRRNDADILHLRGKPPDQVVALMSEPKGPPSIGDPVPARKSSKKSSSRPPQPTPASQPVQTPVTTSSPPVGAVPQVPRIPLAEPKPDADSKRKSSKKRTSQAGEGYRPTARESTPPGPAVPSPGPDAVSADVVAAAKQKEDAEREKHARREAKKQRAKEVGEAKRREDVAKQAMEEAQHLEEQRKRGARQKQQLEALNANAEECQEEAGDDYDEDFENYDEDFEQEEVSQPKSTLLPTVGAKASLKNRGSSNAAADEAELKRIQQAMQAENKELLSASSRPPSSSGVGGRPSSRDEERSARPSTSISSSIAGLKQSLDPRAKRTKEILERRKFDVEKVLLFQQNPVSEQDKVLHRLRRGLVKQAFVQTSDGARSLSTQTKAPEAHDKSMHFPDDIGIDTNSSSTMAGDSNEDGASSSSSTRFFKFLEHAAYVCETLAVENVMASETEAKGNQAEISNKRAEDDGKEEEERDTRRRYRLSKTSKLDKKLVFPSKKLESLNCLEKILQGRDLVAIRFSPSVSSTFLSCYGAAHRIESGDDNQQQEPAKNFKDKTISCVWDVNLPNRPLHLLKSEGVAATACLSPSRDLFVVVGTEDGTIHVWDLRPQSMIQSSSVLVDGLAVCTPAYSTCGMNYRAPEQHTSTVVALESIDRNKRNGGDNGGTFQFGSMDDRGILIIWSLIEFESGDEALVADKCVQIGGNVKMVMNTRIDMQQQYLTPSVTPKQLQRRGSKTSVLPTPIANSSLTQVGPVVAVLKYFPHDPNQFIVGTRTGQLVRGHRFENKSSRMQYQREQGLSTTDASIGVVCIDFHPFEPDYFLVGYEDGSICLYHAEVSLYLTSWEEVPFGVSVCAVTWSPSRPAVFYASFSNGSVLVWDLLESTNGPTLSHDLDALKDISPVELASSLYPLVLSSEKMRTSRPAVAWRIDPAVSPFQFTIHELDPDFTTRSAMEQQTVAKVLTCIL